LRGRWVCKDGRGRWEVRGRWEICMMVGEKEEVGRWEIKGR